MARGKALAYICSCLPDKKSKNVLRCKCNVVKGKGKGRTGTLAGAQWDGAHCRGKEGRFVPVPACTGRDPTPAEIRKAAQRKAAAKKKKAPAKKKKAPAKKKKKAPAKKK